MSEEFRKKLRSYSNKRLGESTCEEKKSKKKRKKKQMDSQINSFSSFAFLPDVVLLKIFNYLSVDERCSAGRVCYRWHQLSSSPSLWKQVNLQKVSPQKLIKLLPSLPSCVTSLQIHCHRRRFCPLWLPEIMAKLNDCCPSLKTFILEGATLVKNLYSSCNNTEVIQLMYDSLNVELLENARSRLKRDIQRYYEVEYCKEKCNMNQSVLLPELRVLSLRKCMFNTYYFFSGISDSVLPNIKVLDLTYAIRTCNEHITLSSKLNCLEELYFARSDVTDRHTENILKTAVKLKVLDLEHTSIGEGTISAIKKYGQSLEKLYLANTNVSDFRLTYEDRAALPRLQTLCVRNTPVTSQAVEKLLVSCHSLTCIDVTRTKVTEVWLENLSDTKKEKLIFEKDARYSQYCDHFKKSSHFFK